MALAEGADYDPVEIEKYVVSHKEFFKRWTLQNITLNQLNAILIEQQMMPATSQPSASLVPDSEETGKADESADVAGLLTETLKQVNAYETCTC